MEKSKINIFTGTTMLQVIIYTTMGCIESTNSLSESANDDKGATESAIRDGTATHDRPEVSSIGGGGIDYCTATLVMSQVVLMASHCVGYSETVRPGASFIINDEYGDSDPRRKTYIVDRIHAFTMGSSSLTKDGNDVLTVDLALLHLATPAPGDVATPAAMATNQPSSGTHSTVIGYGCNGDNYMGTGIKRYREFDFGECNGWCAGDSGGPNLFGTLTDNGRVWGIVEGAVGGKTAMGDVVYHRAQIDHLIRS